MKHKHNQECAGTTNVGVQVPGTNTEARPPSIAIGVFNPTPVITDDISTTDTIIKDFDQGMQKSVGYICNLPMTRVTEMSGSGEFDPMLLKKMGLGSEDNSTAKGGLSSKAVAV